MESESPLAVAAASVAVASSTSPPPSDLPAHRNTPPAAIAAGTSATVSCRSPSCAAIRRQLETCILENDMMRETIATLRALLSAEHSAAVPGAANQGNRSMQDVQHQILRLP
ncbi:hypothetical protein CAOG_009755 [Capsaspora owczarzaki ATCC 30864]|uniref:Uncharacterized protein n=1 Tax=Capsaspora owczarzaki (strain ATCC 30864) TaxID=595528 RepID=A0A0D2VRJ4_CAPO3|nr:hypothetical protein CAOG_009755 [Capsaspora owczarzaki ATCC 30864]